MITSNTKCYPQEGFMGFGHRWTAMLLFIAMAVFGLVGCNGGGGDDSSSNSPVLAVNVLSATGPVAADPADQSGDLLLSRLSVTLASDATVEQLDAAMAEVGATGISYSSPGSPYLTLSVPRQSDGAALVKLAETLRSMPGILFAAPGRQMSALILPGQESGGSPQSPDQLQHLLPSRFPAAWNAAFAENGRERMPFAQCSLFSEATVIIADFFQSRPSDPSDQLRLFDLARPYFGAAQPGPNDHGWQVAATLANLFDEFLPTGATPLPQCVEFVLVDISGLTYAEIIGQLQQAIVAQPSSSRLIVNLSFGFGKKFCGPNMDLLCTPENLAISPIGHLQWEIESRILAAIQWAEFDNNALDERLLLVQAAGNENASLPENGGLGNLYRGIRQATMVSPVALATQLGSLDPLFSPSSEAAADLWTSELQPSLLLNDTSFLHVQNLFLRRVSRIPGMANLLLVGSSTRPESGLPGDIVESQFSNEGFMLLAVGEEVVGLGGTLLDGTSYAAPQVAGLAAYLWSISDLEDRPASETAMLIRITTTNASFLDAYAAILSLDTLSTIGTVGIREALMDVDGNGVFDEQDLQKFATAYGLDDPNTPTIPESRDHSRFDLNGDGATGGIPTAVFDLDRGAVLGGQAPMINAVDRQIEGYTVSFNEAVLSDIQILCYYAYSTLYADDNPSPAQQEARTAILGPDRCVLAKMYTNFPGQISDPASLTVSIEVPASGGQYAPAENMLVNFTPSCGSVSPASGRTDAEGNVTTTVTPTGCTSSVSVTAVARANEGMPVLAQETVTATVNTGATIQTLAIQVGVRTPGMIEAWVYRSDQSSGYIASGPISNAAEVMDQVSTALAGQSELSNSLGIMVYEPVNLTLNLGIPVGSMALSGQPSSSCGSSLNVTVGNVVSNAGVGGCLGNVTLTTGDVGGQLVIQGTDTIANVTTGVVGAAVIGYLLAQNTSNLTATVQTQGYGALGIHNTQDSTVRIGGSLDRQPPRPTANLNISNNHNLSLDSITGGTLNSFTLHLNSFASPPSILVGDIVHPGPPYSSPDGSVKITNNSGLSLGGIRMGSIGGNLAILSNLGFSNTDAMNFANERTIVGTTSIFGNEP